MESSEIFGKFLETFLVELNAVVIVATRIRPILRRCAFHRVQN